MPAIGSPSGGGGLRAILCAATLGVVSALALPACGGDDGPSEAEPAEQAATDTGATETTAQPPPESAEQETEDGSASGGRGEETLTEEAATGPQSCADVVIAPHSGDGLFAVEAEGITCEDASAALQAWGESGYPGAGPPGFACEEVSEGRLSCEQEASGGVVEFDTGT